MAVKINKFTVSKKINLILRLKVMGNTIDDEREDPFVSLSDSDVEQEAINELDSEDENDEIIDV